MMFIWVSSMQPGDRKMKERKNDETLTSARFSETYEWSEAARMPLHQRPSV